MQQLFMAAFDSLLQLCTREAYLILESQCVQLAGRDPEAAMKHCCEVSLTVYCKEWRRCTSCLQAAMLCNSHASANDCSCVHIIRLHMRQAAAQRYAAAQSG